MIGDSSSKIMTEHDIEGFPTIRMNKIKTDDYISIYKLSDLDITNICYGYKKSSNGCKRNILWRKYKGQYYGGSGLFKE